MAFPVATAAPEVSFVCRYCRFLVEILLMLKCGARVLVSGEPRRAWPRISSLEV